jgi:hypothetical protein
MTNLYKAIEQIALSLLPGDVKDELVNALKEHGPSDLDKALEGKAIAEKEWIELKSKKLKIDLQELDSPEYKKEQTRHKSLSRVNDGLAARNEELKAANMKEIHKLSEHRTAVQEEQAKLAKMGVSWDALKKRPGSKAQQKLAGDSAPGNVTLKEGSTVINDITEVATGL